MKHQTTFSICSLALPFILLIGFLADPCMAADRIKRKGRFLHTEIENFEDVTSFSVVLVPNTHDDNLKFKFTRLIKRTIHEIKVYEMVLDNVNNAKDNETLEFNPQKLTVIPDEFAKEDPSVREEILNVGPFKNTKFIIEGEEVTTDKEGFAYITQQTILNRFDDFMLNTLDITISHAEGGEQKLTLSRLLFMPEEDITPAYKKLNPQATLDILEGLGLNFKHTGRAGRTTLAITCDLPETITKNAALTIKVTVTNTGKALAGNLILSTFSRESWIDGKLFYIGALAPGETRSFSRVITVPESFPTSKTHVAISAWDTCMPHPEVTRTFSLAH